MWRNQVHGFVRRVTFEARLGKPTAAARVILSSIYRLHMAKITTILSYNGSLQSTGMTCDMFKISIILAKLQNEKYAQHKWHTSIMHMWMQPTRVEGNRMRTRV